MMMHKMIGAAIGNCSHTMGLDHFMEFCERTGWLCSSLGCRISPETLIDSIRQEHPELVAVSYRLSPEDAGELFRRLKELAADLHDRPKFIFGGTPEVATVARECGLFDAVFDGTESREQILNYLEGAAASPVH